MILSQSRVDEDDNLCAIGRKWSDLDDDEQLTDSDFPFPMRIYMCRHQLGSEGIQSVSYRVFIYLFIFKLAYAGPRCEVKLKLFKMTKF